MFKSLRWRLLAWHAGILVVTVAGFGAVLYYQIRHARLGEIDADLQASARTLEGTLRGFPPDLLDGRNEPRPGPDRPGQDPPFPRPGERGKHPPPPPHDRMERQLETALALPDSGRPVDRSASPYFIVWRGDGEVLKASNLPSESGTPGSDATLDAHPRRLVVRQRGQFREVLVAGPNRTQILVGRSIGREQGELTALAWQVALTGLVVLSVGLIGGVLLSARAVRPLAVMSTTAAGISAANLHRRIDVQEVDSELGNLAAILNDMFARLEAAFERQARFTADASHELRTPLAVIHSHVELALSRPRSVEEYQETLETCIRASRRMRSLVEGLLTLARADVGKLDLRRQPLDLGALVQDSVTILEPLAAQKSVCLRVEAPPLETSGDVIRLTQVITNLVANAINYNRSGGHVTVTLAAEDDEAALTVADTGHGIPEEDCSHIFDRFYRVDKARSRELGGSGLGLAICKSIVEGLGGSIAFTTELNQGTTFVVRLPLKPAGRSEPAVPATNQGDHTAASP